MMQSRCASLLEAGTNVMAGLILSFVLQRVLFMVLGIVATARQNLVMTVAFSAMSLARSYVLRRLFIRFRRDQCRLQGYEPARDLP